MIYLDLLYIKQFGWEQGIRVLPLYNGIFKYIIWQYALYYKNHICQIYNIYIYSIIFQKFNLILTSRFFHKSVLLKIIFLYIYWPKYTRFFNILFFIFLHTTHFIVSCYHLPRSKSKMDNLKSLPGHVKITSIFRMYTW